MVTLRLFAAMWMLLVLPLGGCDPGTTLISGTEMPTVTSPNACNQDFASLSPKGWKFIQKTALGDQCVVLYTFDSPREGSWKAAPIKGMVYRTDHDRPMDIHAHPLRLPGGIYLGEHQVSARMDKVLSELQDPDQQLVVEDRIPEGITVMASLFKWDKNEPSQENAYKSLGWFVGDGGVTVEGDKVTVLKRRPGTRSQLADRLIYLPRDKKSYYQKGGDNLVEPVVDLVSLDIPADPATAEYPEKPVLAFYESLPLKDIGKLEELVGPEPVRWLDRNKAALGCLYDSTQVLVRDLDITKAITIPSRIENGTPFITDTVTVKSQCALNVNGKETRRDSIVVWWVRWERESNKWQLIKASKP